MMSLRALELTRPLGLACALVLFGCAGNGQESPPPAETPAAETPSPAVGGPPPLMRAHDPTPGAPGGADPRSGAGAGQQVGGPSPHGELQWATPAGWTSERPGSPMRMAQYSVPATSGDSEAGECVVFYFGPGQGGDASSNVARWASQFSTPGTGGPAESRVTEQKLGARLVTRIEVAGTYQPTSMSFGGETPPPRPGYMLLGAIVPGGDANWFFRCTGPEKTIQANRAAFDGLVASIK